MSAEDQLKDFDARLGAVEAKIDDHLKFEDACAQRVQGILGEMKAKLHENTELTAEIKNLALGFKMLGQLVKWASGVGAATVATIAAWNGAWAQIKSWIR